MAEPTQNRLRLEHVFAYGTLKRGQCRQGCWPVKPVKVTQAWTFGKLIDLGPYPALLAGTDRVWGELWSFETQFIDAVHFTLDQIEVYNQPGVANEYERIRISVQIPGREPVEASTYRFADSHQASQFAPMRPSLSYGGFTYVVWPAQT